MDYKTRSLPPNLEVQAVQGSSDDKVLLFDSVGINAAINARTYDQATYSANGSSDFYQAMIKLLNGQNVYVNTMTVIVSKASLFNNLNLKFLHADFDQGQTASPITVSSARSSMDQNTTVLKFDVRQVLDVYTGIIAFVPAGETLTLSFDIEDITNRDS
jgi:hypothetical protein